MLHPAGTDIDFRNDVRQELIGENRHYLNGSGVAVGDINSDGLVDIYFARLDGPNNLYKNLGGYRFRDITDEAGVAHKGYNSTGVVFADVNGDGHLDLLVSSLSEGNALYINDGNEKFELKEDSGLHASGWSWATYFLDVDLDGFEDLLVATGFLYDYQDMDTQLAMRRQDSGMKQRGGDILQYPSLKLRNKIFRLL